MGEDSFDARARARYQRLLNLEENLSDVCSQSSTVSSYPQAYAEQPNRYSSRPAPPPQPRPASRRPLPAEVYDEPGDGRQFYSNQRPSSAVPTHRKQPHDFHVLCDLIGGKAAGRYRTVQQAMLHINKDRDNMIDRSEIQHLFQQFQLPQDYANAFFNHLSPSGEEVAVVDLFKILGPYILPGYADTRPQLPSRESSHRSSREERTARRREQREQFERAAESAERHARRRERREQREQFEREADMAASYMQIAPPSYPRSPHGRSARPVVGNFRPESPRGQSPRPASAAYMHRPERSLSRARSPAAEAPRPQTPARVSKSPPRSRSASRQPDSARVHLGPSSGGGCAALRAARAASYIDIEIAKRFKSMQQAFLKCDEDRDGRISKSELLSKCKDWNIPLPEAQQLLQMADLDLNGSLDFREFSQWFRPHANPAQAKEMQRVPSKPKGGGSDTASLVSSSTRASTGSSGGGYVANAGTRPQAYRPPSSDSAEWRKQGEAYVTPRGIGLTCWIRSPPPSPTHHRTNDSSNVKNRLGGDHPDPQWGRQRASSWGPSTWVVANSMIDEGRCYGVATVPTLREQRMTREGSEGGGSGRIAEEWTPRWRIGDVPRRSEYRDAPGLVCMPKDSPPILRRARSAPGTVHRKSRRHRSRSESRSAHRLQRERTPERTPGMPNAPHWNAAKVDNTRGKGNRSPQSTYTDYLGRYVTNLAGGSADSVASSLTASF